MISAAYRDKISLKSFKPQAPEQKQRFFTHSHSFKEYGVPNSKKYWLTLCEQQRFAVVSFTPNKLMCD